MTASLLDTLFDRAFERVPAAEANAAMAAVRERLASGGAPALSYEAVLPEDAGMEHLEQKVLPRLVYFLDCRGAPLPTAAGVFLSIFRGDGLYFLHTEDFFDVLSQATGLSMEEMVTRYGAASVG